MIRSLYTGESGVKSHQTRMDVIGNNIANVNTVGFKSGRATFADIISQNLSLGSAGNGTTGSTNPKQIGLGTGVSAIDTIFTNGSLMTTGKNTDLALSGEGMFVVRSGNETYYTRDGAFEFDAAGNYVLPGTGHIVQGWMASDGVINATGAVGDIKNISLGQPIAAQATTEVDFIDNLNADSPAAAVTKVKKTETTYEEVTDISVLEVEESRYNLNVTIGENDYILHDVMLQDIDLNKTWTVKSGSSSSGWNNIELEDEDGNVSSIEIITKNATDIRVGDTFTADTSRLRLKSTVNEVSPLEFSVNGMEYKAVQMDHSVEIPGEDWVVTYAYNYGDKTQIGISQMPNGVPNGCYVGITLDKKLDDSQLPAIGGTLEFSGEAYTAKRYRPVTVEVEEEVVAVTGGVSTDSIPVVSSANIYDSLGNTHQVPFYFLHEGTVQDGEVQSTNNWLVSLDNGLGVKKGDSTSYEFVDVNGNKGTVTMSAVELQFDSSGHLLADSDTTATMTISYDTTTDEPEDQTITVDFAQVTQYASSNTVHSVANGNVGGTLESVSIDSSGTITGYYSNGLQRPEAQVAVAHFSNYPGLLKTGTSLYQVSANSGTPVLGLASAFGTTITPGALEMSNVGIAEEFSNMIITQRGFQSNAKIITVSDEMIETAVNMKR